jgi:hypothetical protein
MEQADINSGAVDFDEVVEHGKNLFVAKFNTCDGRGRPETTGGGAPRAVPTVDDEGNPLPEGFKVKLRTSAPDADACAGCHNDPEVGGAGDFVANVFVLAQTLDPVTLSVGSDKSNDRNTLGMHGSGPIEMLTREMTADLQSQAAGLSAGIYTLTTKGVDFTIEVDAGGNVVATDGGVDADLVVKPFHQAGKVTSLREFSTNAMNHHHGMQAEERFDLAAATGFNTDFDNDGYHRELTLGDQTAISIFQAQLDIPQQVIPKGMKKMVEKGEEVFDDVGCTSCHVPELELSSTIFVEPNPFNPPRTCSSAAEGCPDYSFDMKKEAGLKSTKVRAYTDLKRHNLCDDDINWFCNEELAQGRADAIDGTPGTHFFLTRKLWDVGNTAPYGHRGDVHTITEAILLHGGEGRASRDAFADASAEDQKALVAFLKTLQIVPDGDDDDDDDDSDEQ